MLEGQVRCQYCNKLGHTANICWHVKQNEDNPLPPPRANYLNNSQVSSRSWIVDSGASHHATPNLQNLKISEPYQGTDALVLGDGTGLKISQTGS